MFKCMLQISWEVFISKIEGQALLLQISKRSAEDTEGNEGKVYHEGEKKKKKDNIPIGAVTLPELSLVGRLLYNEL